MTLLTLFWTFFKIGAFTFGGGYAMLPLIEEEVTAHGWMTMEEIVNFVAVSESTPGPFAINAATYVGATVAGVAGAFFATLGVILPSFLIILLVARVYKAFQKNRVVQGVMSGLRPAVIGLIGAAFISVLIAVFKPSGVNLPDLPGRWQTWVSAAVFALSVFLMSRKLHPILIICIAAAVGVVAGQVF